MLRNEEIKYKEKNGGVIHSKTDEQGKRIYFVRNGLGNDVINYKDYSKSVENNFEPIRKSFEGFIKLSEETNAAFKDFGKALKNMSGFKPNEAEFISKLQIGVTNAIRPDNYEELKDYKVLVKYYEDTKITTDKVIFKCNGSLVPYKYKPFSCVTKGIAFFSFRRYKDVLREHFKNNSYFKISRCNMYSTNVVIDESNYGLATHLRSLGFNTVLNPVNIVVTLGTGYIFNQLNNLISAVKEYTNDNPKQVCKVDLSGGVDNLVVGSSEYKHGLKYLSKKLSTALNTFYHDKPFDATLLFGKGFEFDKRVNAFTLFNPYLTKYFQSLLGYAKIPYEVTTNSMFTILGYDTSFETVEDFKLKMLSLLKDYETALLMRKLERQGVTVRLVGEDDYYIAIYRNKYNDLVNLVESVEKLNYFGGEQFIQVGNANNAYLYVKNLDFGFLKDTLLPFLIEYNKVLNDKLKSETTFKKSYYPNFKLGFTLDFYILFYKGYGFKIGNGNLEYGKFINLIYVNEYEGNRRYKEASKLLNKLIGKLTLYGFSFKSGSICFKEGEHKDFKQFVNNSKDKSFNISVSFWYDLNEVTTKQNEFKTLPSYLNNFVIEYENFLLKTVWYSLEKVGSKYYELTLDTDFIDIANHIETYSTFKVKRKSECVYLIDFNEDLNDKQRLERLFELRRVLKAYKLGQGVEFTERIGKGLYIEYFKRGEGIKPSVSVLCKKFGFKEHERNNHGHGTFYTSLEGYTNENQLHRFNLMLKKVYKKV